MAGRQATLYRAFKYTMYFLLALNIVFWFREDLAASAQTFAAGVTWRNAVEAFASTVDTLAWVILLLLFELETAVIPDEKLRGSLKWVLSGIRAICYTFITYALYGYVQKYGLVTNFAVFNVGDICTLVGSDFTYVDTLDDYLPITPEVCVAMQGQSLLQLSGTRIIGTTEQLTLARHLALTDVVNASTWLVVVVALEIEVYLQLRQALSTRMLKLSKGFKVALYSILFACAVYWGIDGKFLDFWDAFLWLVAFMFIEMNIFQWHARGATEAPAATSAE